MNSIKKLLLIKSILLFALFTLSAEPALVPWPKSVKINSGSYSMSSAKTVAAADKELAPLAKLLCQELLYVSGAKCSPTNAKKGDITLKLNSSIKNDEGYKLNVTSSGITVEGKNYRATAWGTVTLLQAIEGFDAEAKVPALSIEDEPVGTYRGLLIDVAREWHPVETMREIINLCRTYKINYIQLHLNDQQSTVFPFKTVDGITTQKTLRSFGNRKRHYTEEEIRGLVSFADTRGVTLVPEISGPGHHAGALRNVVKRKNTLDIYNEKTYEFMAKVLAEVADVFASSPYIHIGGDEGRFGHLGKSPEEKAYKEKHKAPGLLLHYIKRIDEIIKGLGKKTIVWEGFHDKKGYLPRDITVMPYEGYINNPKNLASQGFPLICTPWRPLYVVNGRRWPAEFIYNEWNMWNWKHHVKLGMNIQLPEDSSVIGAQMCAWEQKHEKELNSTRERLNAVAEKTWNPKLNKGYESFASRVKKTDQLVDRLSGKVYQITTGGLLGLEKNWHKYFWDPIEVELSAPSIGTIRYTLDGSDPTSSSTKYTGPIKITGKDTKEENLFYNRRVGRHTMVGNTIHVKATIFDKSGKALSDYPNNIVYWHKNKQQIEDDEKKAIAATKSKKEAKKNKKKDKNKGKKKKA